MESRVISMCLTPKGRMVHITLKNKHCFSFTPPDVRRHDIRVGDTLGYSEHTLQVGVRLELRPASAVPFQV